MNVIYVSHLNKKYGNFTAVKDISFHVKEGELFGFLGIFILPILILILQNLNDNGILHLYNS